MKFNENKTIELSPSLIEYLCYKIVKKHLLTDNFISNDIVLITENFLSFINCKNFFKLYNKKYIIILHQNEETHKWNLILIKNLKKQINNCFNSKDKKTILANIISSNLNYGEENYILNQIFDKFDNIFNFKLPIEGFEANIININDQKNTSIFILNFIEGLICQKKDSINLYIQKLFDKNRYIDDKNYMDYFDSFNKINDNLENILPIYKKELIEYFKKNKNYEKYFNGNDIVMKNEMAQINEKVDNKTNNEKETDNNFNEDKTSEDSDLKSEEEEEALRIMELHNRKSKKRRKFIIDYQTHTHKLKLETINYKNIGIIKEEDNESSSESLSHTDRNKEKCLTMSDYTIKKVHRKRKEKLGELDIYKTNDIKDNEIIIKKNLLKELEDAIYEFENEQSPKNNSKKRKKNKIFKKSTTDIFLGKIEKEKKRKKKKSKKREDTKEKMRSKSSNKLFESSSKKRINFKKILNFCSERRNKHNKK